MKRTYVVGAILIVGLLGLILVSLVASRGSSPPRPRFEVIDIDVSDSGSEEDKLRCGEVAMSLIRTLDPSRDRLIVLKFDGETTEICSEIPADIDSFTFVLRDAILKESKSTSTRHAVLFDSMSRLLSRYDLARYDLSIRVFSDGGNDDHSEEMENLYTEAAERLSNLETLKVLEFWCVITGRQEIRNRFQDLDREGRLRILGPGEGAFQ